MRRLTLKSEHLTELADAELSAVNGGSDVKLHCVASLMIAGCLSPATFGCTAILPSINVDCPTLDIPCRLH